MSLYACCFGLQGKINTEKAREHLHHENTQLTAEVQELSTRKAEAERKIKMYENQMQEANARLHDDEAQVAELQSVKSKLQKELEATTVGLEEMESRFDNSERQRRSVEAQFAETQVT